MMTAQPLDQFPKWRDSLVYHLRMKDISGDRIGDILLEADAHLRESGETPDDAFGDAKQYATVRAEGMEKDNSTLSIWLIGIGAFAGSYLTISAALGLGRDEGSVLLMPPWLALVIGVVMLVVVLARLPDDLVRHPTTGNPLIRAYPAVRYMLGALIAIAAIGLYIFGRQFGS